MEGEEEKERNQSRVVKVDSKETWDSSLYQPNNHGSLVSSRTWIPCVSRCSPGDCLAEVVSSDLTCEFLRLGLGRGTLHGIVVHNFRGDEPFLRRARYKLPDVLFLTVDVDDVKDVASRLEIKAMPTFLIIKDGAPVDKLVGANPEEIKKRVNSYVQSVESSAARSKSIV